MSDDFNSVEIELLTSKLIDDLISYDERERLAQLLQSDHNSRARYSYLMLQESLLHWEESDGLSLQRPVAQSKRIINFPVVTSLAASIAILVSVWFGFSHLGEHSKKIENSTASSRTPQTESLALDRTVSGQSPINHRKPKSQPGLLAGVLSYDAHDEAMRGIEILETEKSFSEGGLVMIDQDVTSWKRQEHLSVPAEMGVLPLRGDRMIKFSKMEVDVDSLSAEVSETIQVLDLRKLHEAVNKGEATFDAEVHFNQGVGLADDSTEFSLSFHAISGGLGQTKRTIAHRENPLKSDVSPQTWEKLETEFPVPEGTDFVVVALSARKSGSDALVSNLTGYYADHLNLNLSVGGVEKIGPL